jgi:hypothetical protein
MGIFRQPIGLAVTPQTTSNIFSKLWPFFDQPLTIWDAVEVTAFRRCNTYDRFGKRAGYAASHR